MYEIEINNLQRELELDTDSLRQRLIEALQLQQVASAELSVAILDDAMIHNVNRDHLQHDYPTDVISFLYSPPPGRDFASHTPRGAARHLEGELVVSAETASRESLVFGWQATDELTLYLVHGLLHLCGYDDLSDEERVEMRTQERAVLNLWGLSPHYTE